MTTSTKHCKMPTFMQTAVNDQDHLWVRIDEIKPIRVMLTSFATQVIEKKLNKEAETTVRPSNGLFVSNGRENGDKTTWVDVGAVTVSSVVRI